MDAPFVLAGHIKSLCDGEGNVIGRLLVAVGGAVHVTLGLVEHKGQDAGLK